MEFTNDMFALMDKYLDIDCIFIDFSKAFDRVPHCRLISKLSSLNLDSLRLYWIRNFLSFHKQYTVANSSSSPLTDVTSGVPQGSVLGPLLFLIYINDLPSPISSNIRLFADDCIIYRKMTSTSDHLALQEDLDLITNWCSRWQMKSFSLFTYTLTNCHVKRTSSYKYLGVHLSPSL